MQHKKKLAVNITTFLVNAIFFAININYIDLDWEKAAQVLKDAQLCFIDYAKAFHKIRDKDIFEMQGLINLFRYDIRLIQNLYRGQTWLHSDKE